ncbi:hypothetical protein ACKKBF_B14595 [Auxenochlorella protothecoides x Auxenochlorella symbiontica]
MHRMEIQRRWPTGSDSGGESSPVNTPAVEATTTGAAEQATYPETHITSAPEMYDVTKLVHGLRRMGFTTDIEALPAGDPALQNSVVPEIAESAASSIAQQAAAAAKHASEALEALLALHPTHPAGAMLASAAQAAAAAAVRLLTGEDVGEEEEEEEEEANETTAHHHHHEGCRGHDCEEEHVHTGQELPELVLSSIGRLRLRINGAEVACTWDQPPGSDTITLAPCADGAGSPASNNSIHWNVRQASDGLKEALEKLLNDAVAVQTAPGKRSLPTELCTLSLPAPDGDGPSTSKTSMSDPATQAPSAPKAVPGPAGPSVPPSLQAQALTWRDITGGAPELQGILDGMPEGDLALVSWQADWVPASLAAEAALALRPPRGVAALLRVRIEATPANRALAVRRVAALPQAKRKSARLVLRSGAHFPALGLCVAPSMQQELAEGEGALRATVAAVERAVEVRLADLVRCALDAGTGGVTGGLATLDSVAPAPQLLGLVKARDEVPLLFVWTEGGAAERDTMEGIATEVQGTVRVVHADTSASPQLHKLAASLGLKRFPALLAFAEGKEVLRRQGERLIPASLRHTCVTLLLSRPPAAGTVPHTPAKQAEEDGIALSLAPASASKAIEQSARVSAPGETLPAAAAAAGGGSSSPYPEASSPASVYDPPEARLAKPGFTRRMPDGETVHYFPKMPCLRCGCPWWTSDEWNARCIRCSWDCESTGYDDDSQPLPKYKAKWAAFVAQITAGKTAPWSGKR